MTAGRPSRQRERLGSCSDSQMSENSKFSKCASWKVSEVYLRLNSEQFVVFGCVDLNGMDILS